MNLLDFLRPKVEVSWVLLRQYVTEIDGGTLVIAKKVMQRRGQPHQVNHDGSWMMARFIEDGDIEGVSHTHPFGGPDGPSEIDAKTAGAWARALGRDFLCVVEVNGKPQGWYFGTNGNPPKWVDVYSLDKNTYSVFIE